jgi:hypothetical protein
MHVCLDFADGADGAAQRSVGREIERYRNGGELALMANG